MEYSKMSTPIRGSEISFEGTNITIIDGEAGKVLRDALDQEPETLATELAQDGVMTHPSEITVDEKGRVVIENEKWTKALKKRMKSSETASFAGKSPGDGEFFDFNWKCKIAR